MLAIFEFFKASNDETKADIVINIAYICVL